MPPQVAWQPPLSSFGDGIISLPRQRSLHLGVQSIVALKSPLNHRLENGLLAFVIIEDRGLADPGLSSNTIERQIGGTCSAASRMLS